MHGLTPDNPRPKLIYDLSRAFSGAQFDAALRWWAPNSSMGSPRPLSKQETHAQDFAVFVVHEFLYSDARFRSCDAQPRRLGRIRPLGPKLA